MQKNIAAILEKQKKDLVLTNINIPTPTKGYVLVKIKYSGICHTQLNEINGVLGKDKFLPHAMGHEGVGEIIKIGGGVKKLKRGDIVVISWVKKKIRTTYNPTSYSTNYKKFNTGGCNTLLNYSLVSEDRVYKLDDKNKYYRESILLGCALPTATNAILYNSVVNKQSKVLVMGMGGLGYASMLVLNYLGCKKIVCIDSNKKKLSLIKKSNNLIFIHINEKLITDFIKKNYETFDLIIDCTGSKKLIEKSFSLLKKYVGKFILIGNTKLNEQISIKAWDLIFGKTVTGAWGEGGVSMKNFKIIEKIFLSQIKNIKKILPKKNYSILKVNKAIEDFKNGKILRPIIKF